MMRRAGFKPITPQWAQREPDRVRSMPTVTPGAFRAPEPVASAPAARVEKSAPVRSEAYRRAVASLPCINCEVQGHSQCAHSNSGKGAGIKASDLDSFPLCTVHPGADGRLVQGCHENFDRGALFTKAVRREMEPVWAADTQRRLLVMGLIPPSLIESISIALQGATRDNKEPHQPTRRSGRPGAAAAAVLLQPHQLEAVPAKRRGRPKPAQ